jgi:hypothetical protein
MGDETMLHRRRHMKTDSVSLPHALVVRALMHVSKACPTSELPPLEAARVYAWMLGCELEIGRKERYAIDRVVCLSVEHHEGWARLAEIRWLPRLFYREATLGGCVGVAWLSLEWWDGSGPCRLKGRQIPLAARIAATAQAWSTLTARGSPELSAERALEVLAACSGTRFDPELVQATRLMLARDRRARSDPRRWPGMPSGSHSRATRPAA